MGDHPAGRARNGGCVGCAVDHGLAGKEGTRHDYPHCRDGMEAPEDAGSGRLTRLQPSAAGATYLPRLKRHVGRLTQTMTYRKSPQKAAARREWDRFVSSNQPVIASTGLPDSIFSSIDHFDNFLSHGWSIFTLAQAASVSRRSTPLGPDALVTLTESYFAAGYEWFTPIALRAADQDNLAKRFAG